MEQYASLDTFRPRLRSDIILGPPWLNKEKIVHYLKDTATERYYRIGEKEDFLLRKMDGSRTLQEIGNEYEEIYRHHLSSHSWKQIMAHLSERHLLTETSNSIPVATLRPGVPGQKYIIDQGKHQQRFVLFSPDSFLTKLMPWANFAFHPIFITIALLIIVMLEIFVLRHSAQLITEIAGDLSSYFQFPFGLIFIVEIWLFFLAHEFAHGLTCKYFGGAVKEIGIMRQLYYFFPYCKIDDVLLFYNRWHRVYTAAAGIFINLLMLLPFTVLWWLTSEQGFFEHTPLRVVSAFTLIIINGITLINIFPFFGSDGYLMLCYTLNILDISQVESDIFREKLKQADNDKILINRFITLSYRVINNIHRIAYSIGSVLLGFMLILILFKREGVAFLLPFASIVISYYIFPFVLFSLAMIAHHRGNILNKRIH
ncbi:M50 family peptidase [Ktedonosporobacter rubrisoli]|uniref:M50 family peptidase n=1 Tax=Ktedonosporobacter rubrisoli TaxID=2509675 RepID=A0A4P6K454_KTERU|nr:M50 family metallopeptidase [Ktedonosporobacter rubrisoli]QBD82835.1 M50 family peptidase [Ktedonosporobacter rubrisoli]